MKNTDVNCGCVDCDKCVCVVSIVNNVLIAKICMLHQIVLIVPTVAIVNIVMDCMM